MRNTNYLASDQYFGHSTQSNGFTSFEDLENKQFYFAYFLKDKLILKSPGYDSSADRDNGIAEVRKNMKVVNNYSVNKLPDGKWVMSLKDGNNQELGRSGDFESQQSALAFLASTKVGGLANAGIAGVTGAVNAGKGAIATGTGAVNAGKGAIVAGAGALGKGAMAAGTGAVAAGTGAAAAATGAAGGFKWAWLLLPLFLIGAFFLYRSCSGDVTTKAVAPPKVEVPTPKVAAPPPAKPKPAAAPVAASISCDLQWILFGFDAYSIRPDAAKELDELVGLLKKHNGTMASLVAYTDARGSTEYNNTLSSNRANAAKKYLQGKGIAVNRIKTSAKSESNPAAKNTDDDSGRQFNRRIELYLLDAKGKEVCGSKAPKISNALKVN